MPAFWDFSDGLLVPDIILSCCTMMCSGSVDLWTEISFGDGQAAMNRMYKEQSIQRDRVVYAYQRPMTSGNVAVASHQLISHLSSLSFTHILRLALSCFMQYAAFSQRSMTERSTEPNA
jgi:hypothetical protein